MDEYNALVTTGNELLSQIQAKADVIERQIDDLQRETDAQLAVARSSR